MTPKQFLAARHKLGLSQTEMGRALGLQGDEVQRTIRRWEASESEISGVVANLMLAMLGGFRPPTWPKE